MFLLVIEIASQFNSFYRRDYQLKSLLLLSVINILTCQRHIFLFFFFFVWGGGGGWRQEVEEIIREGERVCCVLLLFLLFLPPFCLVDILSFELILSTT